ncbi:MAG: carboxylating nicotinate-nucleotide diphosphorylase [Thermoplasmata archaeon]|nr:carboxylating nicotinate-nucleotide diphosphorylase [Thermoplasmata archaeon]
MAAVRRALTEDRAGFDRTTLAVVDPNARATAVLTAQGRGVLCGGLVAAAVARSVGLRVTGALPDGARLRPGRTVLEVEGSARSILSAERTMLNFVMHLSGVATATASAVRYARPLAVLATRKTLPGLRALEKAAVVAGGGLPHRQDLAGGILVKSNHLALVSIPTAVARLRESGWGRRSIEVEVGTPAEALSAARAGADALLIDNASPSQARRIVRALERAGLRRDRFVELSGGITLDNVGRYRRTGADAVSMGALTHSAPALPFHLTLRRGRTPAR